MELKKSHNKKEKEHVILHVQQDSIAMELGILPGDRLMRINDKVVKDALDYHLLVQESMLDLLIFKEEEQEAWLYEIEKNEEEDLGLEFDNNLMDEYRSCRNGCVFCFIDQLPKGMRETLYFKDDDARLSFLQGNYITLTNMTEREVSRVIEYRLSPINISIHTMNLELRKSMLKNKKATLLISYMDRLKEADIQMNGQIVLCKGLNDQEELIYTLKELEAYLPQLQSVSIVPVGISNHRNNLYPLEAFTQKECEEVIDTIESWQHKFMKKYNQHVVHCGDEFYALAGRDMPEEARYDNYAQLENGVGMTRVLINAVTKAIEQIKPMKINQQRFSIGTGVMIKPIMTRLMHALMKKIEGLDIQVIGIENNFFGERITISGLLVGHDLIQQLKTVDIGSKIFIPDNILKNGEEILLDDTTLKELKEKIDAPIELVDYQGETLIQHIMASLK